MIQPPLLFSGTSNRQLADEIAKRMQTRVGNALVDRFKNDECRIEIRENVRGAEVFVVQSLCRSPQGATVNDSIMELLLIIDALRRASANRITAVIPYYGYAKQDKKTKGREPISAKLVANMIETAGRRAHRDARSARRADPGLLRHPGRQPDGRADAVQLPQEPRLCRATGSWSSRRTPAACRAPRLFAKRLKSTLAVIIKRRPEPDVSEVTHIVGDVEGKIAVVVDDMISTGGTLVKAAEALRKRGRDRRLHAGDARHLRRRRDRPVRALRDQQGDRDQHDPAHHRLDQSRAPDASRRSSPTRSSASRRTARSPSCSTRDEIPSRPPDRPPPAQRRNPSPVGAAAALSARRRPLGNITASWQSTTSITTLTLEPRTRVGTTERTRCAAPGRSPASSTATGKPTPISVDAKQLAELIHSGSKSRIVDATIGGTQGLGAAAPRRSRPDHPQAAQRRLPARHARRSDHLERHRRHDRHAGRRHAKRAA